MEIVKLIFSIKFVERRDDLMKIDVKAEVRMCVYSDCLKLFEQLKNGNFFYNSDYYDTPFKFNISMDENTLFFNQTISLTNSNIENIEGVLDKVSIGYIFIPQEFAMRIFDLFMAIQLSNPGAIDFHSVKVRKEGSDQSVYSSNKLNNPVYTSLEYLENNDQRSFYHTIEIDRVWEWLKKFSDFWVEVPKTKLGRTLNYLRYIFYEDSPLNIVWLFMATECLLVEGDKFQKNQIMGKSLALCNHYGLTPFPKKEVNAFYGFRSNIVHGGQRFYRPTLQNDATDEVTSIDEKNFRYGRMAHQILLVSLRYLIENNKYDLNFEEIVEYRLKM